MGYEGGYDAVRRYARGWQREQAAVTASAFVPLSFDPGEAYQFDWSHEVVLINGTTVQVKVAHVRLCHSRMMFVRAYPRESQEMVFDAHDRAFAFFRGACTRGIYDNSGRMLAFAGRRPRWTRSSWAAIAPTTGAFSRCAGTTWSIRSPARRRRVGEGSGREPARARDGERGARRQGRPRGSQLDGHEAFVTAMIEAKKDITLDEMVERLAAERDVRLGRSR